MQDAINLGDNKKETNQPQQQVGYNQLQQNGQYEQNYSQQQLPYIQKHPIYENDYYFKRQIDLMFEESKMAFALNQERERNELYIQKENRKMDVLEKHENRYAEVQSNIEGCPILLREMLYEDTMKKKVANVSHCVSYIYIPDIVKPGDEVQKVLQFCYHNSTKKLDDSLIMDVTIPDSHIFKRKLEGKGIKLLCGRRKKQEYAEKFLEWLISEAKEIRLPREQGFTYIADDDRKVLYYTLDEQPTWRKLMETIR